MAMTIAMLTIMKDTGPRFSDAHRNSVTSPHIMSANSITPKMPPPPPPKKITIIFSSPVLSKFLASQTGKAPLPLPP
jgi:hypothetical protein